MDAHDFLEGLEPRLLLSGLTVSPTNFQPTAGSAINNVLVATFTDSNPTPAPFTATINWGDGDTTASYSVTVDATIAGQFDVVASKSTAYAREGAKTLTVSVQDNTSDSAMLARTVTVADAPLTAGSVTPPVATEGQSFSNVVLLHFTDADPGGTAADFTGTINWGDGNISTVTSTASANGQIVAHAGGGFDVLGSHTYVEESANQYLSVQVQDAGGAVTPTLAATSGLTYLPPVSYAVDLSSFAMATGDFNGDGKVDLAVASASLNTVDILLGNGNGTFQTSTSYAVGATPRGIAVGDFNGDGKLDLAVADTDANTVSILLGNGNGTFQTKVDYAVGAEPLAIAAGDLNGDGKTDLVVADYGGKTVSVLLGNGDGTFQRGTDLAVDNEPSGVVICDFNGDGKADLAVVSEGAAAVNIMLGNGDGTFQSKTNYAVGYSPISATTGDFNGDGKTDLAVVNLSGNSVSVLLGNGDGTFRAKTDYALAGYPNSVVAGDFNGDGKTDLAVANGGNRVVSILAGNGDGTFQARIDDIVGNYPGGIVAASFRADGRTDLAVLGGDNTVKVLLKSGFVVADAPLTAGSLTPPVATEGQAFSGVTLFHFTDADPAGTASDYSATITWGDGNTSTVTSSATYCGQIVAHAGGGFDILGSYQYAEELTNQTFRVVVTDNGGASTSASTATFNVADAALTAGTLTPPQGYAQVPISNALLLHFTDADLGGVASDYSATITWGDGNVSTVSSTLTANGQIVAHSGGGFDVLGSHTYPNTVSNQIFQVQVSDAGGAATSASTATFSIGAGPIMIAPTAVAPVEGAALTNILVATFTNSNAGAVCTAAINWGDGGATAAYSIAPDGSVAGQFDLYASKTSVYAEEGNQTFTVTIQDNAGGSATLVRTITVSDALLSAGAFTPPVATEGQAFSSSVLFHFTDADPAGSASDYSATITWGDGNVSTVTSTSSGNGQIVAHTGGGFDVLGSHTYAEEMAGQTFTVQVRDSGGAPAITASINSFSVADAALTAGSLTLPSATEGQAFTNAILLHFTDADSAGTASDYSATITWGDGNVSTVTSTANAAGQVVAHTGGGFDVLGSHTYAEELRNAPFAVQVTDSGGATVNASAGLTTLFFPVANYYNIGSNPHSIALGDFNGDGVLDLADATIYGSISVLLGIGTGKFGSAIGYNVGVQLNSIATGDFNGDGKLDLAVASSASNTVLILQGNGDGTFQSMKGLTVGNNPDYVAVGDFNGDGKLDLAVANNSGTVSILLGNGDGTFQTGTNYSTGTNPNCVVAGDFNADGKLDLAVSNSGSNTVSILLGQGNGTFQAKTDYAVGTSPRSLTMSDFNGDGRLDLGVACTTGKTVSVLLGNGDGSFQARTDYSVGYSPVSLATGDFNGDGITDLAVADSSNPLLYVLLGNGNGIFQAPSLYIVGLNTQSYPKTPEGVVAADFNGDGKSDLAVAVAGDDVISVLQSAFSVADAALSAGALTPPISTEGQGFTNATIFHFTDANPLATVADYTATITWGDGLVSVVTGATGSDGQIVANAGGGFDVLGTHVYSEAFTNRTFKVVVTDSAFVTASASTGAFSVTGAPLTAGVLTLPAATEGQAFTNVTLFHFTDADPAGIAADYTATITWGDGSISNVTSSASADGQIVANAGGGFDVVGSHTYAKALTNTTFKVQVSDVGGATASASSSAFSVADAALTAGALTPPVAAEGQAFSSTVLFHFTDANGLAVAADYSATITWGDGSVATVTSTATADGQIVANSGGGFDVLGSHTYSEELTNQTFRVQVTDAGGALAIGASANNFSVADAAVTAGAVTAPAAVLGQAFNSVVMFHFTDGDPAASASDYTATITWGDGTTATVTSSAGADGRIVAHTGGGFDVLGSHTYSQALTNQTFRVQVGDTGGATASASTTITINPLALTVSGLTADNKVYDGTVAATLHRDAATLQGLLSGDLVTLDVAGATAAFGSKNVGTGITVTVTGLALAGPAAANYTLIQPTATADITAKPLTVTLTASNKTYDGTVAATITGTTLNGTFNGDAVTLRDGTATFSDKNVGVGKIVTDTGLTLAGSDAGNYTLANTTASTSANITTANAVFLNLTAAQSAKYGGGPATLTGTLTAGVTIPAGQTISITAGIAGTTAVIQADGSFSASLPLTGLNAAIFNITYGYAGDGNCNAATDSSTTLTITPATVTITADACTKVYGSLLPTLTATVTGLVGGDTLTTNPTVSTLATDTSPVSGSPYAITVNGADSGTNYTIQYVDSTLTVTPALLTITADAVNKTYGAIDPALTYTSSGLVGVAAITGSLCRAAGENVGSYAIGQGTLDAGANYAITYTGANLTITVKALMITADAGRKIYGDADPALTYSSTGLVGADTITGSLSRAAGENVGSYAIGQGTLTAGNNYAITYTGANLTITAKTLIIAADAAAKIYGAVDPALTYNVSGLVGGDAITGSLSRAVGENVGSYAISQGTLDAGANYAIAYTGANLTITAKALTIVADAVSKIYGDAEPALIYSYTGLVGPDTISGNLARAVGENVGTYAIDQGTVTAGSNYAIAYTGANLTITAKALTIAADAGSKIYGDVDPALTYSATGLVGADTVIGSVARVVGEDVGTYAIGQGTLTAGSNYAITYNGANLTITAKTLAIAADAAAKVYGAVDPALTYNVNGLMGSGTITGSLSRAAGENVGAYAIGQGTLDAGANYAITYTGANLTITVKALMITADAGRKIYGDADPALTYNVSGLVGADAITGSLSRAAGENVGAYTISQGAVAADSNYTITFAGANLTITAKVLALTADAVSKTYGVADPALTYTSSGLVGADAITGSLCRAAGEDVGSYAIGQGTLDAGGNYAIAYMGANLTITAKTLTITADVAAKIYGAVDPALTYNVSGLVGGDAITGSLSRAAGENVGAYAIGQGALTAGSNYVISYTGTNLMITAKELTIVADAVSKTYGEIDPALTYTSSGLVGADAIAGNLSRAVGENVGTYAIGQGTLDAGANYAITYTGADLTITAKVLALTADAVSKTYGAADPALTYTSSGLVGADAITGSLCRAAGENVGSYAIGQGTLDAGGNYAIAYTGANLTITAKDLVITADAGSKIYGDVDPALTYSATGLVGADNVAGNLARVVGEDVGTYAIGQGTLTAGSNYAITYTGANLTITAKTLAITADAVAKIYGAVDPALTYTSNGLVGSDPITGNLTRAVGENVGTYAIGQGTLTAGNNYAISYIGANLTITAKALTITADAVSKIYGVVDPALTYTSSSLVGSDTIIGSLMRTAGETVGTYAIDQGTLTAGSNYAITYTGANLTITGKSLTITADAVSKIYGAVDPALTYSVSGLVGSDAVSGSLSRVAGENVGTYAINQGTVTAGDNYAITYTGASLTITAKSLTITADVVSKVYGNVDPAMSYTTSGLVGADTITGRLTREAGENVGAYAIGQGTLIAGGNYAITYTGANLTILPRALTVTAIARSKAVGQSDPPLTYNVTQGSLVGTDAFSGSLIRAPGESVGTYAISQGTLTAGSDYTVSFVPADFMITLSVTVVNPVFGNLAAAPSAVYGSGPVTLTGTLADGATIPAGQTISITVGTVGTTAAVGGDGTFSASLPISGLNVAGGPYTIIYNYAGEAGYFAATTDQTTTLTITPATVTITADARTKVYGAAVPMLMATVTGLLGADTLISDPVVGTAATATSAVSDSPYAITAGGAVATTNYTIQYVDSTLTVTPATLTITADAVSKTYGNADPALTYSSSGLVGADTVTGNLARVVGENVGTYAIGQGALTAGRNYAITFVAADFNITPAAATITPNDQSQIYGGIQPALTATVTGLVNGDTALAGLVLAAAPASSHVGTYNITVSDSTDTNYTFTLNIGTLTITPATLTVTANSQTKAYGAALPTLTASYAGLVNGDTAASLPTAATLSTTATAASHVADSPYTITASGAVDSDYTISYVDGALTVTPVGLTITADNQTKAYGAALPTLTASYTGLANGDTAVSLTTGPALNTTATAASHVAGSPYTITASGAVDSDYTISYVDGALTVTPVALTITADNQAKAYGAALPTLTTSYTGLVNGDTASSLPTAPALNTTATAGSHVAGSPYTITASGAVDSDYTISYVDGTLTVTPVGLTITADNQTKVYGAALPTLTVSYAGLVNGDTAASLTTAPALNTTATVASHVAGSPYTITAGGAVDSDYTISYVDGAMTVTPVGLTITVDNQTKEYGAAVPTLTASYAGLVNGDTAVSLTTAATLSTTATASSHVAGSPYTITASSAVDSDYTISYVDGALTVTPAALTITADSQTKVYGQPIPTLTGILTGVVTGDGITAAYTTNATQFSDVGNYPITAALEDPNSKLGNYSWTPTPGTLTIGRADQTITWNAPAPITYGMALDGTELDATVAGVSGGSAPGALTYSPAAGTVLDAGAQTLSVMAAATTDYNAASATVIQQVNPGSTITVLVGPDSSPTTGVALTLTATVSPAEPGAGSPTGTVTFFDGANAISGPVALTNGVASFTTSTLIVGNRRLTAQYSGDASDATSTSTVFVEYVGSSHQRYVNQLYNDLFHRDADPGGLHDWTALLDGGTYSYQDVATAITSSREYDGDVVDAFYVEYLGRHSDPGGLNDWVNLMQGGYNAEQIRSGILGSPEYFADTGGTNTTFVTALYQSFLSRAPDTGGLAAWVSLLDNHQESTAQVAGGFLNSDENRTDIITGFYQKYMHRAPDPGGLADWKAALANGISQPNIISVFLTVPEYMAEYNIS